MTHNDQNLPCKRFEKLIHQEVLSEEEGEFFAQHVDDCPLDIHTFEALDRLDGLPTGTLRNWNGRDPLPPSDQEIIRKQVNRLYAQFADETLTPGSQRQEQEAPPKAAGYLRLGDERYRLAPLGEIFAIDGLMLGDLLLSKEDTLIRIQIDAGVDLSFLFSSMQDLAQAGPIDLAAAEIRTFKRVPVTQPEPVPRFKYVSGEWTAEILVRSQSRTLLLRLRKEER